MEKGTVVVDTARGKTGVYMAQVGRTTVALRPVGGGIEWNAHVADVRRATPEECAAAQSALLSRPGRLAAP